MKTLCLDFDGVIHSYKNGWKGATMIPDPPVDGALEFILEATQHYTVAIHSSRSGQDGGIPAMKDWIAHWMLERGILSGSNVHDFVENTIEWPVSKPGAYLTIDDRAITFRGVFPTMSAIENFRTWQQEMSNGN